MWDMEQLHIIWPVNAMEAAEMLKRRLSPSQLNQVAHATPAGLVELFDVYRPVIQTHAWLFTREVLLDVGVTKKGKGLDYAADYLLHELWRLMQISPDIEGPVYPVSYPGQHAQRHASDHAPNHS